MKNLTLKKIREKYAFFCWLIAFLLLNFSAVKAQHSSVRFTTITTAEGLSQNNITAIYQDYQGFMWIGTPDGLHRYDGYSFVDYKHLPNDSTSLISNNVSAICEDNEGNIWVGTQEGISKWIRSENTFDNISFENLGDIPHRQIRSIFKDNKGNLWIGSKQGLSFYKTTEDVWVHLTGNNRKLALLKDLPISAITQAHNGDMWVGSDSTGLYRIVLAQTNGQVKLLGEKEGIQSPKITALASDEKTNTLWVGSKNGLFALDLSDLRVKSFYNDPDKAASISQNHIKGLLVDKEGTLWVGTASKGLNFYTNNIGFTYLQKDVYDPFSLSDNTGLKVLFQDKTGIFWFGTAQGGINKYDPNKMKFRLYRSANDLRKNGVQDKTITAFYRDNDNRLWIGTQKAGVFKYNPTITENGWFTQYSNYTHRLPSDNVTGIVQDLYRTMWVSTADRGVARFSYKNGELDLMVYRRKWQGLPSNRVSKLFKDKRGEVWLLTYEGDLCKFDRAVNDFEVKVKGNLIRNEVAFSAKYTDKNKIWVGTPKGTYLYDVALGEIVIDKRKKLQTWVSSIETVGDSTVWWSSSKGLIQYFPKNDSLKYFSRKDGLPSDMIYAVILGNDDNLWLSTSKGIAKFSLETLSAKSYDESNGLQGNDFLANSYYESAQGEIFFGGNDGYNAFFPDEIKDNPKAPQLAFTEIDIFSKSVPLIDYTTQIDSPLDQNIVVADSLTLNYEKNGFSLEFAALHFSDPKKNKYAYKMEGLDQNWTEVGAGRRFVNYPSLPYGNYVFKVKAANSDGVWTDEAIALHINVLTPIWERIWFRVVSILLILGVITAIYMNRVRRIKNQKVLLENEVRQQTSELKEKNTKMLDSLRYAENIQQAILPTEEELKEHLPEVFTVYEPLDIVSGDFYWFKTMGDIVYVAVADCTGHGVPGAFMSMIGSSLLSDMVQQNRSLKPCETLTLLNQKIRVALSQEDNRNTDGMDVCFCKIDLTTNKVWFTGAKRPLYIVKQGGSFVEIKGDRKSVGGRQKNHKEFTTTEIQLQKGDMIYLTSDGYVDQSNEARKKFGSLRLHQLLEDIAMLPASKQRQSLIDNLQVHKGIAKQRDDIAIMGIRL